MSTTAIQQSMSGRIWEFTTRLDGMLLSSSSLCDLDLL